MVNSLEYMLDKQKKHNVKKLIKRYPKICGYVEYCQRVYNSRCDGVDIFSCSRMEQLIDAGDPF